MMTHDNRRAEFSILRVDYYNSGRLLLLSSCVTGAGIMLGYAIELSCKAAFHELGVKGSITRSHDLNKLLSVCRESGIFNSVKVSDEFMDYANDRLHQRYPSQQAEALIRASIKNRFFMHVRIEDLEIYDDLLIQMDDELIEYTKDEFISVGVRNAANAYSFAARGFFHCNGPATLRLRKYIEIIKRLRPDNKEAIGELEKGEDYFWHFKLMPKFVKRNLSFDLNTHPAEAFQYPAWQDMENGNKYINIKFLIPIPPLGKD